MRRLSATALTPANDNAWLAANDNQPDLVAKLDDILRASRRLDRRAGRMLKKAETTLGHAYLAAHR